MEDFYYPYKLYKIRLVKTERDIFGDPILSHDWDKIVKLLYEDVKQEVFHFVHPKNKGIVYQRNYADCPVNGNAILTIGRLRDTTDYAIVSIITKSYMYHEPYLALEEIEPAFPNPKILLEIVRRGFNSALKQFGLEVELNLWDSEETSHWRDDRWASYIQELKKHPEISRKNLGFQQAIAYASIAKDVEEKKKEKKEKKKHIKSDCIYDYMVKGDKELIIGKLHEIIDYKKAPSEIAIPIRYLCDVQVFYDNEVYRLPFKAFIKEFETVKGHISESSYNEWINNGKLGPVNKPKYKLMPTIFESMI